MKAESPALEVRREEKACIFDFVELEDSDGDICIAECTTKDAVVIVALGSRNLGVFVVGFASALESREGFSVGGL